MRPYHLNMYMCSNGHSVKAENAVVSIDSLCRTCARQAHEARWREDPFFAGTYSGQPTYHVDATSRIERVARFNTDQCRRALLVRGLQKTVRQAVERRRRNLEARR